MKENQSAKPISRYVCRHLIVFATFPYFAAPLVSIRQPLRLALVGQLGPKTSGTSFLGFFLRKFPTFDAYRVLFEEPERIHFKGSRELSLSRPGRRQGTARQAGLSSS